AGVVPESRDRISTWMPAMWWAGRASSQAPGPPSRSWVAAAEARSAAAGSSAPFGVPVVPEVAVTSAVSAGTGVPAGKAAVSRSAPTRSRTGTGSRAGPRPSRASDRALSAAPMRAGSTGRGSSGRSVATVDHDPHDAGDDDHPDDGEAA